MLDFLWSPQNFDMIQKSEKENESKQKNQSSERRSRFVSHSGFCTQGGNRTRTPCSTGFWIQRVYQFRHLGVDLEPKKIG